MTVLDFITLTRRSWRLLLVFSLIGVSAGGAYGLLAPKSYESSSSGFVASQGASVFGGTQAAIDKATSYLALISSKAVRDKIATDAGVNSGSLDGRLSARMVPGGTLIEVTASASDPHSALTLANGALAALASVIGGIEAKASSDAASRLTVVPMENAVAPTEPSSPNLKLSLAVGAGAGLVLGYAAVFLRRALDVRVRAAADLGQLSGSGILGRIPRLTGRLGREGLSVVAGESLRQIRTGLRFASVDRELRSIVVTSPNQSEGKSTLAAALARVIAEGEESTLIVDCDLRRPAVHRQFEIDGAVGLSEVLSGQIQLADAIRPTENPRLFVLPAGGVPPNPSEMLGSATLRELLEALAHEYFVVVDAPPVLPVTDVLLVGSVVDGTVLIASSGKTRKADVTASRALLEQARARVLGSVLNMVPLRDSEDGYSYYRQYRSYYSSGNGPKAKKVRRLGTARPRRQAVPQASRLSRARRSAG